MPKIALSTTSRDEVHRAASMDLNARSAIRRRVAITVASILGLIASFFLDQPVHEYFARSWESGQAKAIVYSLRSWGEGTTILFILIAIAWVSRERRELCWRTAVACLIVASTVSALKPLTGRLRPDEVQSRQLDGAWWCEEGVNSSFPSGHVGTAFAFAHGISMAYPVLRPLAIVGASGTALSRMADGRHFLSDCVAGAILGWTLSAPILLWKRKRRRDALPWSARIARMDS